MFSMWPDDKGVINIAYPDLGPDLTFVGEFLRPRIRRIP